MKVFVEFNLSQQAYDGDDFYEEVSTILHSLGNMASEKHELESAIFDRDGDHIGTMYFNDDQPKEGE